MGDMELVARIEGELGRITEWTAHSILARRAELCGGRTFLNFLPDGRNFTYAEFHSASNNLVHDLVEAGVKKGSHVGLMAENSPEFLATFFALGKMGAVAVPINTSAKGNLLRHYLGHADCAAVVIGEDYLEALAGVLQDLPKLAVVIVIGDHNGARQLLPAREIHVTALAPLRTAADIGWNSQAVYSDLLLLLFTSGTTGPSKAIMYTHASTFHWAADNARYRAFKSDDIDYVFMPLFHGNALILSVVAALMAGTSVALTRKFSASRFLTEIRSCGATRSNLLGVVAMFLWAQPPGPGDRDHNLRVVSLVPTPVFTHEFERRFGVTVFTGYGLTDYCMATTLGPEAPPDRVFSCGKPRHGIELKIVDDLDRELPAGETGEIVLRNAAVWGTPTGYYKMPEETLESRRNLMFHTGDRGYLDREGYLYFVDRKKDAIRRRGENISAHEVESVMSSHPAVEIVAVYPVRAAYTEDEVAATVVLRTDQQISAEKLAAYCLQNMSEFMVPRFIEFSNEMPLTPSQKIEKYKLRQRAEADMSRFWDRLSTK